jgi:hypothetical protein
MITNIRVKTISENGAIAILTWRHIECKNSEEAFRLGMKWATVMPMNNTVRMEIWFPATKELDDEQYEWCREKAEFEMFCGGYDDY